MKLVLLALSLIVLQAIATTDSGDYVDEWVIEFEDGSIASSFARKHGLQYWGPVGALDNYHLFKFKNSPSNEPWESKRSINTLPEQHQEFLNVLASFDQNPKRGLHTTYGILSHQRQQLNHHSKRGHESTESWWLEGKRIPTDPLFSKQWHLYDTIGGVSAPGAWSMDITGKGVIIGIADDGLQHDHPDLKNNYDADASWNFNHNNSNPYPENYSRDYHGTECSGVAAAVSQESCGVGAAFNARLAGMAILQRTPCECSTDAEEAAAFTWKPDDVSIISCSWGPNDDGKTMSNPKPLATKAIEHTIKNARGGKGRLIIWASGNGKRSGDSCAFDGYASSRYTITVGASTSQATVAVYSEACSGVIAVVPGGALSGSGITTCKVGKPFTCNEGFKGTSAAAPLAAGILALMLEANPDLSWLEVQYLIQESSTPVHTTQSGSEWHKNAAGIWHSNAYGFGLLNATKLVQNALAWEETIVEASKTYSTEPNAVFKTEAVNVITVPDDMIVHHVTLSPEIIHGNRGALKITLIGPDNTPSVLAIQRGADRAANIGPDWTFNSLAFWGMNIKGDWTLRIESRDSLDVTLKSWSLTFYGIGERTVPDANSTAPTGSTPTESPQSTFSKPIGIETPNRVSKLLVIIPIVALATAVIIIVSVILIVKYVTRRTIDQH